IKRLIFNSNTTLLELAEKLSVCILKENKKTEYTLFRASIPKTVLTSTANTILPNVCNILHKYLTAEMLKIQKDQIKQVDFDNPNLFGENQNFTNITAKSMLNLVDKDKIVEISSTEEPFLVAQKFEIEKLITIGWNSPVPYFNVLVKEVHDTNNKVIDERKLYGEAWGKARAALMPSSDSNVDSSDSSCEDEVKINNGGWIQHKGKGRPKGTDRIRCAREPSKKTKRKLHCKICGGAGHNQ
ncbi:7392_t:CDS:2, partial [Gigaspora rosea]